MRSLARTLLAALFAAAIAGTAPALAAHHTSPQIKTLAGILAELNHYPSDTDKQTLQGIVENESATDAEKTVARALMNVEHTVAEADRAALEAVASDESAPESLRTVASILLGLNHTPSAEEKAQLSELASAM